MIGAGVTALLMFVLGFHLECALADEQSAGQLFDSVAAYTAQGADHNFKELPEKILTWDIEWEKSYFIALGLGKTRGTLGESLEFLNETLFADFGHGYELVLVQHRGLQSN